MTLDDLERLIHTVAGKMHFTASSREIWMKINPYYQQHKRSSMILVSRNIWHNTWIFAGVPQGGAVKLGFVNDSRLQHFRWLFVIKFHIIKAFQGLCYYVIQWDWDISELGDITMAHNK